MKISLYLPKGSKDQRGFLKTELAAARNIKDRETRKTVESGLSKLLNTIWNNAEEIAFFTDGEEVIQQEYKGIRRIYYCGRDYHIPEVKEFQPYLLIVVDANEATIGTTNGERIDILWHKTSYIMGKHSAGGWSQARFSRGREEALKHWLRKIVDIVKDYHTDRDLIVGGPGMTKDRFIKELPVHLQAKVVRVANTGYTDENGLWEMMGMSRYQ